MSDDRGELAEQLQRERRARGLLQWIAVAAAKAVSVSDALQAAVDEVCRSTGWPVGHVLQRHDGDEMRSTSIWHLDDPERYRVFREVSDAGRFASGVGLPGRVLATGQPLWIMDVTQEPNFPRARQALDIGVRAAFGFPVPVRGEVAAVLEFFSSQAIEPDLPLLEVMSTVGAQLGRVIERVRAEEALRQSELRFRSVAETAYDAIVSATDDGRIVGWNRGACSMFGYSEEEALGRPLSFIIPERYRVQHEAGMARVRAGGERRVIGKTAELEGLRRDGSRFPVELSLATWRIGEASYYSGIIRDITERKLAEERLRIAADRLERSEREAVAASQAKSLFLANMSHELRTPLNAILGFAQLLQRDAAATLAQRESLDVILRSGEHLLGLINAVLSIAKIEAGESSLQRTDFDLARLAGDLREMFHLRARSRGLNLDVDLSEGLPPCLSGDEGKLRQVLINLLGNAVKFTEAGGVALRVRWREGRAAFEVEDTGPGIAAEELERLFEPFAQAASGRRAREGTGLGLALSRDFVRLLGGELHVHSAPGQGTRFSFEIELPVADAAPASAPRRVLRLAPGQPERRILVVDNAPDNRRLLSQLLSSVGFLVREAADGGEAVAAWEPWRPALVWMDLRMPVLDGYQATRRIRALEAASPERERTVVVALTASVFEDDRPGILACGCDEIVIKPFRESAIFEALERRLDVRFLYEEDAVAAPAAVESGPAGAISDERLRALPAGLVAELHDKLAEGDDLAARSVIERIATCDEALALALRDLVRSFRFDDLLAILERISP